MGRKLLSLVLLLGMACEQDKPASTPVSTTGGVTISAELVDVQHMGHVYVVEIVHGHFIHSPACPFDPPAVR